MKPFITIITPSLQRDSLLRCVQSVNDQTLRDWQHIIMLDVAEVNEAMFRAVHHPQRIVIQCDYPHRNFGNTCRHLAWQYVQGEWTLCLDDDNFLADKDTLKDLSEILVHISEPWTLWPILRHGKRFFNDPPGNCHTDTANMIVRTEMARWPDGPEYTMDGIFCEQLKAKYPYVAFPNFRPIVVMERSSEGK
jgi:glycosyltransferase involved in cell wall biosynthesis